MSQIITQGKANGVHFVHCHGVFDLVHPGHINHFESAKKHGDKLIVSITPDCFVNKGPGRPAFKQDARLKQLACLNCVDYVVLNDQPDAVSLIKTLRAQSYAKGVEYSQHHKDVTGKIAQEVGAVESVGGQIVYTDGEVFSSSELINQFIDKDAQRMAPFVAKLRSYADLASIQETVNKFQDLTIMLVGDAILDSYQYVTPLGQSGKGQHICATLEQGELFLGGSLIVANHLASFVKEVILVTCVGEHCPHLSWIKQKLAPNVRPHFICHAQLDTLIKKRYIFKDGEYLHKIFETYSHNQDLLDHHQTQDLVKFIEQQGSEVDAIFVSDFGNGFTNPMLTQALSSTPTFLALNTQTNSGNRGFNVVTHYSRADFISLNEPEVRLAAHDRTSPLATVCHDLSQLMSCSLLAATRGTKGALIIAGQDQWEIPIFTDYAIDRVGAGDSFFALASLAASVKAHPLIVGLLGSAAAAIKVHSIGNKQAVERTSFLKYIIRLVK
ncbi:MAG: adenylyltransferase/cytidyltransferase family protein [Verrucomicrobia bacterium]|nr:adenylyltransferase/cytidyltransferase family protein [Verrucomicrobiota bacterium]